MSYPIMPALPISLAKGIKKTPRFNTVLQKTVANRGNSSVSLAPYPVWDFEFDMDRITGNEALGGTAIAAFFGINLQTQGSNGLFLFTDPQDSVIAQASGIMLNVNPGAATPMGQSGDGVSAQFQLARLIGAAGVDIIQNLNGSITLKVNGVTVNNYSVSSTGVVTFSGSPLVVPGSNATLTWAGSFYYLCRFEGDILDATRNFTTNSGVDQWDVNSIKFASEFV